MAVEEEDVRVKVERLSDEEAQEGSSQPVSASLSDQQTVPGSEQVQEELLISPQSSSIGEGCFPHDWHNTSPVLCTLGLRMMFVHLKYKRIHLIFGLCMGKIKVIVFCFCGSPSPVVMYSFFFSIIKVCLATKCGVTHSQIKHLS